jgi:competence protein ComEC
MAKKEINKLVKKASKKSPRFLALLVVGLLITNLMTLYLWINEVPINFVFLDSNSTISSSTITSSTSSTSIDTNEQGNVLNLGDGSCKELSVHYLNLLQIGDSIVIECDDIDIVVDAGEKGDCTNTVLPALKNDYVKDGVIELVIVTHADSDHNGGFIGLSKKQSVFDNELTIRNLVDYGYRKTYELDDYELEREALIQSDGTNYCSIQDSFDPSKSNCFSQVKIGDNFKIEFLQTDYYDIETEDNGRSITFLLTYEGTSFFFGGDITVKQEERLLANYELPHINYYKASHHGSYTSNSLAFLQAINPDYIFLNCEEGNKYGIPQKSSVDIMDDFASGNIYVTGLNGTITVNATPTNKLGTVSFELNDTKFIETTWYSTIMAS